MIPDFSQADFARDDRDTERILFLNDLEYGVNSPVPATDVVSTKEIFTWRRDQNPVGQAAIPVIRNSVGDVVGFIWLIPLRIRIENQNYTAAMSANMLIAAENRGRVEYVKLMRKFTQALRGRGAALHFGFVSNENYTRLQADSSQTTFTVPVLVRPLDLETLIRRHVATKWLRFLGVKATWMVSPFFRRRPPCRSYDISIQMTNVFDERFDVFWNKVKDKHRAIAIRDLAFLKWRFAEVGDRRYHILVAHSKCEMLGYCVIRCANVRGLQTGLILDLLTLDSPAGNEAGLLLVADAEAFFRTQQMTVMLTLMAPGSAEYRTLKLSGCRSLRPFYDPRPFRFAFFVQDSHREELKRLATKDWFITLADFESL